MRKALLLIGLLLSLTGARAETPWASSDGVLHVGPMPYNPNVPYGTIKPAGGYSHDTYQVYCPKSSDGAQPYLLVSAVVQNIATPVELTWAAARNITATSSRITNTYVPVEPVYENAGYYIVQVQAKRISPPTQGEADKTYVMNFECKKKTDNSTIPLTTDNILQLHQDQNP